MHGGYNVKLSNMCVCVREPVTVKTVNENCQTATLK
jgi:hypothetical protein